MSFDALIIGAGISGLYQLHKLREMGLRVRVLEAGTDVGGTWYWNRYPGARFDSESYSYGYSWSQQLLDEWQWSEHFSPQPETLAYVNFVADKFDLRRDIDFKQRVHSAKFDEQHNLWHVSTQSGQNYSTRWLITAIGVLSTPQMPAVDGIEDFQGPWYHTGLWPHEAVDFKGKRVAVIGTGASGVQLIQEVAKTAAKLTVFQRRPNWCAPLHNRPISTEEQAQIQRDYRAIFDRCRSTHGGFLHDADPRYALEQDEQEREAFFENLYNEPGFGIWLGNYRDIYVDEVANKTVSEFVAKKIRERVNDPEIAAKLIPTDHGFGTRRVPMETGYYEVYNQANVELVSLLEDPLERITARGVQTSTAHYDADIIIYATGFDAVTGAFDQIEFCGRKALTLREKWATGPRTFLGLAIAGFPNLLTLVGPHNAATFCNIPRCIEQNVEWVSDFIAYLREHGYERFEALPDAERDWTAHVVAASDKLLLGKVESWFMGFNSNRSDKSERTVLLYAAGAPTYRARCDEVAAQHYLGFSFAGSREDDDRRLA